VREEKQSCVFKKWDGHLLFIGREVHWEVVKHLSNGAVDQWEATTWKARISRPKVGSVEPTVRPNPRGLGWSTSSSNWLTCGLFCEFYVCRTFWVGLLIEWALLSLCSPCVVVWFAGACLPWIGDVERTHGSHVAATPQLRCHDIAHRWHHSYSFYGYFLAITILPRASGTTLFLTKICVRNALCSFIYENIEG
jgi:hypothetical protein